MIDERDRVIISAQRLLTRSRAAIVAQLTRPYVIDALESYLEANEDGNGATGGRRVVKKNILRFNSWQQRWSREIPELQAAVRACATTLYEVYGSDCYWAPSSFRSGTEDFQTEPIDWVSARLCWPLVVTYSLQLRDPSVDEHELIKKLAAELADFLATKGVPHRLTLLVGGVTVPSGSIFSGDVEIRSLTWEEISRVTDVTWNEELEVSPLGRPFSFMSYPTAMITLSFDGRKIARDGGMSATGFMARVLAGLSLVGVDLGALQAYGQIRIHPFWLDGTVRGTPPFALRTSEHTLAPTCTVTQDSLERALQLAARIPKDSWNQPRSHRDVICHRYMQGMARQQEVDRIFDLVVSMESSLVNDKQEVRHKFSLYGAQLIGQSAHERLDLKDQFAQLYDLRSSLAHGGKFPTQGDIQAGASAAEALSRRVLIKCLEDGWPEPGELDAALLSDGDG